MAWTPGYYTVSATMRDYDNSRTGFSLRLAGAATAAAATSFAATFAAYLQTACQAEGTRVCMVEKVSLSQAAIPDGLTTATEVASSLSDVERKGVFIFETEPNTLADIKYSVLEIPCLDPNESDGTRTVCEQSGTNVNLDQNHTSVAAFIAALAPAVPSATVAQGCNVNTLLYVDVNAAYKYHREQQAEPAGRASG